jgi:transcription antitermination factor NusG
MTEHASVNIVSEAAIDVLPASYQWFALRVRPRAEHVVAEALDGKGYQRFLPLCRQRRRWSDRVVDLEVPLFPGYVFSRFDVRKRLPILTIPGVVHIVSIGRNPEPVDDAEIEALQVLVGSRLKIEQWPFLHIGERVRILRGPLTGAEGILVSVKKSNRLVVSVTLLQRSVAVEIPEDSAWPVSGSVLQ